MSDIVKRLREEEAIESEKIRNGTWDGSPLHIVLSDAADEIERLQAELREAREAMTSARESLYSLTHLLLPDEPGFEKAVDGLEELDAFLAKSQ